jgi:NitT/TauT family transport system substrate-binding protein
MNIQNYRRLLGFIIALIALVSIVASCDSSDSTQDTRSKGSSNLTTVRLIQEWTANANYAGAEFAKHRFAEKNGLVIDIVEGTEQRDAVLEVVSGRADFGDASADKVLLANLKGADLVVIGTVSQYSPTCFITKRNSGITTPRDFVGKKVGVLTGTNTEKIYRILLAKSGVLASQVSEVEAPFDLTSFIQGQYDVRPAFIYDEPVTLKHKFVAYNIIDPLSYGIKFVGTVYFTQRATVQNREPVVQAFVNSIADGWRAATRRPDEAITFIKADFPQIDEARELESLNTGMNSFVREDGKLLLSIKADWSTMISDLSKLPGGENDFQKLDLDSIIANQYLENYYVKTSK